MSDINTAFEEQLKKELDEVWKNRFNLTHDVIGSLRNLNTRKSSTFKYTNGETKGFNRSQHQSEISFEYEKNKRII